MKKSGAIGLLALLGLLSPARARADDTPGLGEARTRASSCLAHDYDGAAFRDPYLRYVYPEEKIAGPPADPGLTYRRIDADIMLMLLERAGEVSPALRPAAARAASVLHELPSLWSGKGFSNVRRQPDPQGIALDTYCIVGWLEGDARMARSVAQALKGDGWLPAELYDGEERFRRDADEAWCLRLLASPAGGGIGSAKQVLERVVADFHEARRSDPAGRQLFYAAYHLALLLEDSPDLGSGVEVVALRHDLEEVMEAWAAARAPGDEAADLLEWANLVSLKLPGLERSATRRRGVQILLAHQNGDGCWRVRGARPPEAGSSFLTLRALLALSSYRDP